MNNGNYKIIFCGQDQKVFQTLAECKELNLIAVNEIQSFLNYSTMNPVDLMFKFIYRYKIAQSKQSNKCYQSKESFNHSKSVYKTKPKITNLFEFQFVSFIFQIYKKFEILSSKFYRQYSRYLETLLYSNIQIIDFSNTQQTVNYINLNKVDTIIVSNWWLLPDEIIYAPKFKTINIHPSRLPQYRGSVPTLWALKNGDKQTAVSFMVLDSGMDSGNIISQYDISITEQDDSITLENKADSVIRKNLIQDTLNYLAGSIEISPQNNKLASTTAKYYPYMEINWANESAKEIVNKIKLYPHLWPVDFCYSYLNIGESNRKILFMSASVIEYFPKQFQEPQTSHASQESNMPFTTFIIMDNLIPGEFQIIKNHIFINAKSNFIQARLFIDLSVKDSIFLLTQFILNRFISKKKMNFNSKGNQNV